MFDPECIFCKLIAGDIPSQRVYEDDACIVFLDIAPVSKGHALVVPKAHHATLFDLPDDLGAALVPVFKRVGKAVMAATGAEGLNVCMNNYRVAGQLVDHAHVHLIPRFADDGLKFWPQGAYADNEMAAVAQAVRDAL